MAGADLSSRSPKKRATLRDVAERAGVSETTASHVLTGRRYVAEATQQRVLQVIKDLKYRPNQVARSLRAQSTSTVAFIVKDIGNVTATISIRGAAALLRERGFAINMVDSPDEGFSASLLQRVLDRLPTGVIFFGQDPEPAAAQLLKQNDVPFIVGGLGAAHDGDWDIVYTDQKSAISAITTTGLRSNPRRVCFIGGDWDDEGAQKRLEGFLQAMKQHGREVAADDVQLVPYTTQGGRTAMTQLLPDPPELLICGSDQIAIGAILTAREAGIAIPDRMKVSGFDNIEAGEIVLPTLTSIEAHLAEQGLLCAEILLRRLNGQGRTPSTPLRHEVRTTTIPRESMPLF